MLSVALLVVISDFGPGQWGTNAGGVSTPVAALGVLILALLPAAIAAARGRSFIGWWIGGVLGVLPALVLALLIDPNKPSARTRPALLAVVAVAPVALAAVLLVAAALLGN